jgi:hypothetical protein
MSLRLDKLDPLPQFESELSGVAPSVHPEGPAAPDLPAPPTSNSLLWVVVAMTIGFAIMLGFLLANESTKLDIRIWQTLR